MPVTHDRNLRVVQERPSAPGETRVYHEGPGHSDAYLMARRIIFYLLDVIEVLLAFRFVFRLFGASEASPFTRFVYGVTAPFVYPFKGIFPEPGFDRWTFEWSVLIAMAVWALVAWGIAELLRLVFRDPHSE